MDYQVNQKINSESEDGKDGKDQNVSFQLISAMDEQYKYEKKKKEIPKYHDRKYDRETRQEKENHKKEKWGLREDIKNLNKDSLETLRSTFNQVPLLKAEIKQKGTIEFFIEAEFRDGDLHVKIEIGTMILVETVLLPAINKLVIRTTPKMKAYEQLGDVSELDYPHLEDETRWGSLPAKRQLVIEWVPKDSISCRNIKDTEIEQLIQTNERAQQKLSKKGKGNK